MLQYCSAAAGLGAGWFVILLVPGTTRQWLLADFWLNLSTLVIASVIVAVPCRGFIARADTFVDHLIRATVIPYLGCLVFLSLWNAHLWLRTLVHGGLANLHDTGSLYLMGIIAATMAGFVVIPYGLLCQYVMNSILRRLP